MSTRGGEEGVSRIMCTKDIRGRVSIGTLDRHLIVTSVDTRLTTWSTVG